MFKSNNARVQQALQSIKLHVGTQEAAYIDQELTHPPGYVATYAPLLAIGDHGPFRASTSAHRDAVRGLLLTGLVLGRLKPASVRDAQQEFLALPLNEVARRMKRSFPFKPINGDFSALDSWHPRHFTTPVAGVANKYRFMVHGIMAATSVAGRIGFNSDLTKEQWKGLLQRYDSSVRSITHLNKGKATESKRLDVNFAKMYLKDPSLIQRNIISTSVITHKKHASYYPFGFILKVPPQNIYSTSSSDQSVANRTLDILTELSNVMTHKGGGRISTPEEILQQTKQKNSNIGYNEVVVVGASPFGTLVKAIGIFVKIHPNGNLYVPPGRPGEPYINDEMRRAIRQCSRTHNLPIVKIVDTSSLDSNAKANF